MAEANEGSYLNASQAADELGISLSTLYSYVSRGLLRSEFADTRSRTRRYHVEDVRRLKERQEARRDPQKVVDTALHWGTPMLSSALTLIEGGRLYYRGQDALELARRNTVEQTAALMWTGTTQETDALFAQSEGFSTQIQSMLPALSDCGLMERFQTVLPLMAIEDLAAYDLRPGPVALTGARILRCMALLATRQNASANTGIASLLQRVWVAEQSQAMPLFNAALILCADHELNVSSFTARCVASAGATPYAVVSAGLAALCGIKHGGMSARVEALFREAARPEQARTTLAQRIRRGEEVPGFGHPLYPDGDPRGKLLLELISAAYPQSEGVLLAIALAESANSVLHKQPNIDFALAALCSALELPSGTAIALFALGRTIGWIGHAIEEYQVDQLIRPRAHYIGILPKKS